MTRSISSREHFHNPVAPSADDPPAILAPDDGTNTFPTHQAMARDLLRTASLFQGPEPETCVVASGD
jgi:hypothetical protein